MFDMTPRRRQPPLYEALGEPPRRERGLGGPVVHSGTDAGASNGSRAPTVAPAPRAPVVVDARAAGGAGGLGGTGGAGVPGPGISRTTAILFLCAAVIGLGTLVYVLGYNLGHDAGQQSVLPHTDAKEAAAITGHGPNIGPSGELPSARGNVKGQESGRESPTPAMTPAGAANKPLAGGMPPVVQADSRKPGFNYLELCPLTWKDAEPAVRYLQAHGVRATAVPSGSKVDPAKPQPNDRFLIIVDQPYVSGNFRASQTERNALVAEVRRLGKVWLSEFRGASDFADPMWRLQRGE